MIPVSVMDTLKPHSRDFCRAFATGCGGKTVTNYVNGAWSGFGSPRLHSGLVRAIKTGSDFYYGDHAYFGRWQYFRITKNEFQHNGIDGPFDMARLAPFHRFAKPWRKGGRHILVCTQTQAYYNRFGIPHWLEETLTRLSLHTDRPIRVRPKGSAEPLAHDLKDAHCVVCCTSNVAVDAVMQGIPALVTGRCAATAMALTDPALVEYPYYPSGRMEWAARLAANQFTISEIAKGMAWERIQ